MAVCIERAGRVHNNITEYFVNVYAWSGAKATLTQTEGVKHTLGIATGGGSTTWKANGESTISLDASADSEDIRSTQKYANNVSCRDYRNTCWDFITRKPNGADALLTESKSIAAVTFGSCVTYTGGTYTKTRGTNRTFGTGVELPYINVKAQSGFNSETKIKWVVTAKTRMCGSNGGWAAASEAAARPFSSTGPQSVDTE